MGSPRTLLLLALLVLPALAASAQEDASLIRDLVVRSQSAADFDRMDDYFGGQHQDSRRLILPSAPPALNGQYWIVRLDRRLDQLPPGTSFVIAYYKTGQAQPHSHRFTLPEERPAAARAVYVGLTGDEMSNGIDAWKLSIVGPNDEVLATRASFLWTMP